MMKRSLLNLSCIYVSLFVLLTNVYGTDQMQTSKIVSDVHLTQIKDHEDDQILQEIFDILGPNCIDILQDPKFIKAFKEDIQFFEAYPKESSNTPDWIKEDYWIASHLYMEDSVFFDKFVSFNLNGQINISYKLMLYSYLQNEMRFLISSAFQACRILSLVDLEFLCRSVIFIDSCKNYVVTISESKDFDSKQQAIRMETILNFPFMGEIKEDDYTEVDKAILKDFRHFSDLTFNVWKKKLLGRYIAKITRALCQDIVDASSFVNRETLESIINDWGHGKFIEYISWFVKCSNIDLQNKRDFLGKENKRYIRSLIIKSDDGLHTLESEIAIAFFDTISNAFIP